MSENRFVDQMTRFLINEEPFFFMVDFNKTEFIVLSVADMLKSGIFYTINGISNAPLPQAKSTAAYQKLQVEPYGYHDYVKAFKKVVAQIKKGNSFLVNLTFQSRITSAIELKTAYQWANAKYKLLYDGNFVCFSPECFVKVKQGYIYSYPMKGTIDASLDKAAETLLYSAKEEQEHNTIVDLIRNDLSLISNEVTVTKFRYLEKVTSPNGAILQSSSEIRGRLPQNWKWGFAENFLKMLPAGSISGAPKAKTLEIIKNTEAHSRGFYTGVFGIFDGENIDSGVAIRYIAQQEDGFWYKSGGGITHKSIAVDEYHEALKKIYIPTV